MPPNVNSWCRRIQLARLCSTALGASSLSVTVRELAMQLGDVWIGRGFGDLERGEAPLLVISGIV